MIILFTKSIGGVQFLIIIIIIRRLRVGIADAVNMNQGITHKANQLHFMVFIANVQDHNWIGPSLRWIFSNSAIRP